MNEQVNKIRDEIEKVKLIIQSNRAQGAFSEGYLIGQESVLEHFEKFIYSLQEEPKTDWLQELQDKIDSLSKEDFEKVMTKYSRYGEEKSVDYDKLNTMLDESLSTETKESWNKRLGEEPASDYLEEEIDKYIKDKFTIDRVALVRFGIAEKDYMYSLDKSDMLALVEHFINWRKNYESK